MVLEHCSNCAGSHPAPLDEAFPFPASEQPITKKITRVTRRTRRTPSLSPPPPPSRDEVVPEAEAGGARQPTSMTRAPQPQTQPRTNPTHHRVQGPGMQPSVVLQPADRQAAAIQAIVDQLARMQQDAKAFQEAAARDREADRQEML